MPGTKQSRTGQCAGIHVLGWHVKKPALLHYPPMLNKLLMKISALAPATKLLGCRHIGPGDFWCGRSLCLLAGGSSAQDHAGPDSAGALVQGNDMSRVWLIYAL